MSCVGKTSSYLGERNAEPLTCSGVCVRWESPSPSGPSVVLSSSNSEVLLSPKSSKCSSSPPMTVTREWLWSSEFRENLKHTVEELLSVPTGVNNNTVNVKSELKKRKEEKKKCQVKTEVTSV